MKIFFLPIAVVLWGTAWCGIQAEENAQYHNDPGLIDIHAHIGKFKGYDLSLKTILAALKENQVKYALISNINGAAVPGATADADERVINEETARVVQKHPQLKPLAWAKPGAPGSSAEQIEFFLRERNFLGIKFHPDFNHFSADSDAVIPYLKLCRKYEVPALFHCGQGRGSSPTVIYEVAKQFPEVPFILYHMGFGTDHSEAIEVARRAKSKSDALIYLETAQVDSDSILKAVSVVGADRVLFGSDATYFGRRHYDFYLPALQALKKKVSAEDFRRIIHDNADRLFRLSRGHKKK